LQHILYIATYMMLRITTYIILYNTTYIILFSTMYILYTSNTTNYIIDITDIFSPQLQIFRVSAQLSKRRGIKEGNILFWRFVAWKETSVQTDMLISFNFLLDIAAVLTECSVSDSCNECRVGLWVYWPFQCTISCCNSFI